VKTIQDVLDQQSLKNFAKSYSERKSGRGPVFFVGSGLSRSAGLPDWSELATKLMAQCKALVEVNQLSEANLRPLYSKLTSEEDLWKKFSLIKEILGNTSFAASVKSILDTDGRPIPNSYLRICELEASGFISLNIDAFLYGAMQKTASTTVYPVYGKDAADRLGELIRSTPFLYQPHGSIASDSSWVFTESDFRELCESALHDEFLTSIFLRDTVVFVGISAHDVGASLRLSDLYKKKLKPGSHYWITTTSHMEKRSWAEDNGIQQILYPSDLGHEFCIEQIVSFVRKYKSVDEKISAPITGLAVSSHSEQLPSPDQLFKLDDIDEIRLILNEIIKRATVDGEISFENYSKICRLYSRAIHSCYMMPAGEAGEKWFGYQITGKALGGKTIGRIVPALNNSGRPVAIKILDQRRYSDELYLSAFRRGVKALKILNSRGVGGTVPVLDAYEVPPTIVMDFVNCSSLEEAVKASAIAPIDGLRAMRSAANTVLQAHLLPEIVLHRDIRPSNLLLENFDWTSGKFDRTLVIDFDLAWHRGALGDDFIRSERDSLGYQAPEQLQTGDSSSRRHTSVDSYGLAATVYFCLSGSSPDIRQAHDEAWSERVKTLALRRFKESPEIAPFLSSLVFDGMAQQIADRVSVAEIHDRLDDAVKWLEGSYAKCSLDFLSEMVCSISTPSSYMADARRKVFSFHLSSGLSADFKYDFLDNEVEIEFNYVKPGNVDNGRADKTLNKLKQEFTSLFSSVDPKRTTFSFGGSRQFTGKVSLDVRVIRVSPFEVSSCVQKMIRYVSIQ
jgi:eukaryotic-like serine/threonine-protein kinase